ncbi:MAG: hypothetical protein Q7R50_03885, partial [Dehalococcoidales bacterium]|nr:hypothetical protein [Dehalococcoidales bacterium]
IGASFATVATELSALSIVLIWSSKIGYGISWRKTLDGLARVLVSGTVMGLFVYYLRDLIMLWVLIPISALLYFIVLFIIKGIDSEDRLLLKRILRREPSGNAL